MNEATVPASSTVPGGEASLVRRAAEVDEALCQQDALWNKGFTRRKFLAGAGMAGVAALGSQLVTTKLAYAAPGPANNGRTLITIFLRGAADGLRVLVPASSSLGLDYLQSVRSQLLPSLLPLANTGGWALNSKLAPLLPLWASGELAFVPAVSASGLSRSHFQAQQLLEHGGLATATTGWLDRTLQQMGPGTTFRAVSDGSALPVSMSGTQTKLSMQSLENFTFPAWQGIAAQSEAAVRALYRGIDGPLGQDVPTTMAALGSAARARKDDAPHNGAIYPKGNFGSALGDLATLLRSEVGVQVATVDVGGWDTHTDEVNQLDKQLDSAARTLAAFMQDLGPVRRSRVTVAVMTEFGRRVAVNGSGGTDHGHGSVMWLLGGGLSGSGVFGRWQQLSGANLDQGDVPGWNNAFDVLGELLQKRLGIGALNRIFPGHAARTLGVARAS